MRAAGAFTALGLDPLLLDGWFSATLRDAIAAQLAGGGAAGAFVTFAEVCVLTNGAVDAIARGLVARAGLEGVVAPLLDVNMAQAFKPDPRVYRFAASQLGLSPGQCMMVASHPWDINGALSAGLRGAYVKRGEAYPSFLRRPEAVVGGFDELADLLLGKPE
ncbi:2-haloacid dehalogenase [Monoraphidium neglectum]|uniref:2-haloacid dehalogenase n=1 Tax=Monoraphidium neglectum TaxID=145388 RepID=A0A0D2M2C6_9CHLO|nr:2-haloacid dehalogenase [Monoraphidium neglectum]KIY95551.1 2-haloacid dehalogenase [Monoraphidium neglectum]|eukprot:XP_013894571.1 2-haloacid dehalogenase [Monoraphidium neglectum]